MRKGKSGTSGLAERRRERGKGKRKADGQQMHITNRKKMGGVDPIGLLCDVLSNENAPDHEREEAAERLLPHYHPKLAKMGPLLRRFLLGPLLTRCLCDQRP
jgi:hypothetical protein